MYWTLRVTCHCGRYEKQKLTKKVGKLLGKRKLLTNLSYSSSEDCYRFEGELIEDKDGSFEREVGKLIKEFPSAFIEIARQQ